MEEPKTLKHFKNVPLDCSATTSTAKKSWGTN